MTKRFLCLLLAFVTVFSLTVPAYAAEEGSVDQQVENIIASGTYYKSIARAMLPMVNELRTGPDAWYWNEDNTTKTVLTDLKELSYD